LPTNAFDGDFFTDFGLMNLTDGFDVGLETTLFVTPSFPMMYVPGAK